MQVSTQCLSIIDAGWEEKQASGKAKLTAGGAPSTGDKEAVGAFLSPEHLWHCVLMVPELKGFRTVTSLLSTVKESKRLSLWENMPYKNDI